MKLLKSSTYEKMLFHDKVQKDIIEDLRSDMKILREKLEKAENLKDILSKISNIDGVIWGSDGGAFSYNLPSNVATYETDILGGQVIKQEATKCLIVDKDGGVKTGLTKQSPDKGFKYKLVRE